MPSQPNVPKLSKEVRIVIDFCLEHAEQAPISRRVSLYHGLAEICCDEQLAANFRELASTLDRADHLCHEFKFNFDKGGAK